MAQKARNQSSSVNRVRRNSSNANRARTLEANFKNRIANKFKGLRQKQKSKQASKMKSKIAKFKSKTKLAKAQNEYHKQMLEDPGIKGAYHRMKEKGVVKSRSEREIIEMEPKMTVQERMMRAKAKSTIKVARAKGATTATGITAASSGVAAASGNIARAHEAQEDEAYNRFLEMDKNLDGAEDLAGISGIKEGTL